MLPTRYIPTTPSDFIGPAHHAALAVKKIIASHVAEGYAPLKMFYGGAPGIGKTALVTHAIQLLGVQHWAIQEYNGTDVTLDCIRDIANGLHLTINEMFGPWRVIRIEEADRITRDAQVKLLTVLDNLPPRTAIFCTTNKPMKDMEERFQRRFKYTELGRVEQNELQTWLARRWQLPVQQAASIAMGACGSVGLALMEAEEYLQTATA